MDEIICGNALDKIGMLSSEIICGDCLEVLRTMQEDSVDAIVTDPPAGISFMGKEWDHDKGGRDEWIAWMAQVASECIRVIKPGGHALVWALPRTSHWTGMAWEEAGWEPRDKIAHVFGSGFPKSLSIDKAIDRYFKAEREVIGIDQKAAARNPNPKKVAGQSRNYGVDNRTSEDFKITAPATPEALTWAGWGSALKPSHEDWWLFRKPLSEKTIAANVLRWGTGGLNIDGCRVGFAKVYGEDLNSRTNYNATGRFPANLIWSHSPNCKRIGESWDCDPSCPSWQFAKAGERKSGSGDKHNKSKCGKDTIYQSGIKPISSLREHEASIGSAARFFQSCPFTEDDIPAFMYYAKASRSERGEGNNHPTVKPLSLMHYLCRLITPPGGVVLDPFAGSGSTCLAAKREGFHYIGIEKEPEYVEIARKRVASVPVSVSKFFAEAAQ